MTIPEIYADTHFYGNSKIKETKFSYSLFLHQQIIDAEYYLANNPDNSVLEGIFFEMLGTETKVGLQSAPRRITNIEFFLKKVMSEKGMEHRHEQDGGVFIDCEQYLQKWQGKNLIKIL